MPPRAGFMIAYKRYGEVFHFPRRRGRIPHGRLTPTATLNLQPGELVSVKSYEDILATLVMGTEIAVLLLMLSLCRIAVEPTACVPGRAIS